MFFCLEPCSLNLGYLTQDTVTVELPFVVIFLPDILQVLLVCRWLQCW